MDADREFWLALKKVEEGAKTTRWKWLSVCATIGVIAIVIGVVKVVDKPPWAWLSALVVMSLIGPTGVITILLKTRSRYVEKNHRRHVELERRLDPERESSEIVASPEEDLVQ